MADQKHTRKRKSVYIVTSGEYSGYSINCVFLSRKAAEDWLAPIRANLEARRILGQSIYSDDRYEIEEWEVGANPKPLRAVWRIEFDRDGNVLSGTLCDLDTNPQDEPYEWKAGLFAFGRAALLCTVEAKNQETAIKIASEKRAQYLARQAGMA